MLYVFNSGKTRVKPVWNELSFNFTILEEGKAYLCVANEEFLKKYGEALSKTSVEYYENLKKYFLNPEENNAEICILDNKFNVFQYTNVDHKMKIKYFTADLKELNYQSVTEELLDELNKQCNELTATNAKKEELIKVLHADSRKCANFFSEHVKSTREREETLLSKFSLILNTKKRKIQYLYEVIEAKRYNMPTPAEVTEEPTKIETVSDSDSEYTTDKSDHDGSDNEIDELLGKQSTSSVKLPTRQTRKMDIPQEIPKKKTRVEEGESSKSAIESVTKNEDLPATVTAKSELGSSDDFCTQNILNKLN